MPIFTNRGHLDQFVRGMEQRGIPPHIVFPLVADEKPKFAKYESWKKLDGLGQVLAQFVKDPYNFVLMLDAELGLGNCNDFGRIVDRLREKQKQKIWYGDEPSKTSSAGAIRNYIHVAAEALTRHRDPMVLRSITDATRNYKVFTWWTDLPFVEFRTGHRMFQHLGKELIGTHLLQLPMSGGYSRVVEHLTNHVASLSDELGVNLTNVAESMGGDKGGMGTKLGGCFEHLLFQLYTVAYEGWRIEDLVNSWSTGRPHNGKQSANEDFWKLDVTDKETFLNTVRPLWLPYLCDTENVEPTDSPILLRYHTDRWKEIGCNECNSSTPQSWSTNRRQICDHSRLTGHNYHNA